MNGLFRKTTQVLAPAVHAPARGVYDLYPGFPVAGGQIGIGFAALARRLAPHPRVVIDGMGGMLWDAFRERLAEEMVKLNRRYEWIDAEEALRPSREISEIMERFLGGDDPLFGSRNTRSLRDFFVPERLAELGKRADAKKRWVIYGTGASLVLGLDTGHQPFLVYADVPKNEIQYRSRAESIANLGADADPDPKRMYKRFYFVDWPALREHQAKLLPHLDLVIDSQRPDEPAFMQGADLRSTLAQAARSWFRVRPWFEPGPWGGQWMKQRFPEISEEAPNLAWSFELISPENGLAFESDGKMLEVAFDFLMFQEKEAVLGKFAQRFGTEFPIRFDYLDTFDGGNLSVQCHPRPEYAWRHFGERFTQDETYYIMDCAPEARVYLGFQPGIDALEFRKALKTSFKEMKCFEVDQYVRSHPAEKHGLYLIPNGTIHCSGKNNLVLEISATPYIFTFKMYDWMRMDLDGRPRPLNIERAMENLSFDRQGESVERELIARPQILSASEGWRVVHLPTHEEHFYDVHRYEFCDAVEGHTEESPHVLNVVEGGPVVLETKDNRPREFAFAETFVVPAATGGYRLRSATGIPASVVKAFLKPGAERIPARLT